MMTSGSYDSQHEMNEAIVWARTNAGRVEILQAKGRRPRPPANRRRPRPPVPQRWIFALADDNQKMVLISHPWDSEQEAEEAMAWVKAVARRAEVRTLGSRRRRAYEAWRRLPREASLSGPRLRTPIPLSVKHLDVRARARTGPART